MSQLAGSIALARRQDLVDVRGTPQPWPGSRKLLRCRTIGCALSCDRRTRRAPGVGTALHERGLLGRDERRDLCKGHRDELIRVIREIDSPPLATKSSSASSVALSLWLSGCPRPSLPELRASIKRGTTIVIHRHVWSSHAIGVCVQELLRHSCNARQRSH